MISRLPAQTTLPAELIRVLNDLFTALMCQVQAQFDSMALPFTRIFHFADYDPSGVRIIPIDLSIAVKWLSVRAPDGHCSMLLNFLLSLDS